MRRYVFLFFFFVDMYRINQVLKEWNGIYKKRGVGRSGRRGGGERGSHGGRLNGWTATSLLSRRPVRHVIANEVIRRRGEAGRRCGWVVVAWLTHSLPRSTSHPIQHLSHYYLITSTIYHLPISTPTNHLFPSPFLWKYPQNKLLGSVIFIKD